MELCDDVKIDLVIEPAGKMEIFNFMKEKIPLDQLESVRDIFTKSDATVALECLCTLIADYDVSITQDIYKDIESLCVDKEVDRSYLSDIKEYVKEN